MTEVQSRDCGDQPPDDIKQLYRSVYALVKQIEERRQTLTSNDQLFDATIKTLRQQLVAKADELIFQPHVSIGRKSREILWRKGFYDVISTMKRSWTSKSNQVPATAADLGAQRDALMQLIHEGIAIYRSIVVRLDRYFDMDLRNIVDFSVLVDTGVSSDDECNNDTDQRFPLDMLNYGVETVHAALLSLGDLHRYFIDFNFDKPRRMERDEAARFYHDAFQLNTKIGMAQNQLGTLFSARRHDLDAMYHYLHSLVCTVPFGLSENNVAKIFAANADYLKLMVEDSGVNGANVRDFLARFKLIADIFFYDKYVTDFHVLCHCLLVDLRSLLDTKRSQLGDGFLFKVVGILMFCLTKLIGNQSPTVHSLNALLVAICAEMVDSAVGHLEKFIESRAEQNAMFQETYGTLYELFDRNVRVSRKTYQLKGSAENGSSLYGTVIKGQSLKPDDLKRKSLTSESSVGSNRNYSGAETSNGNANTIHQDKESRKKTVFKVRRRRRRLTSGDSDDHEGLSNGGSDYDSEDHQMHSDFSSTDDGSDGAETSDEDPDAVEEDPIEVDEKLDITLQPEKQYSDSEDLIVEEERLVYKNGSAHADNVLNEGSLDRMLMQLCHISEQDAKLNSELIGIPIADHNMQTAAEKLHYQLKYKKVDPNIIIEFAQHDCTLQALKLLFDWLRLNHDLLINCYASNPEFVHKIMRLMNHLNVDMFTNKVCFDRSALIKIVGIRSDLHTLFNARTTIPLHEDLMLKDLAVLSAGQQQLDFESRQQLGLSPNEEMVLRLFKLVDFGFFVAKSKQFAYNFCARSRLFVMADAGGANDNGKRQKSGANGSGGGRHRSGGEPSRNRRSKRRKNENRVRKRMGIARPPVDSYTTSADENDVTLVANHEVAKVTMPKKSYLKNRNHQQQTTSGSDAEIIITQSLANDERRIPKELTSVAPKADNKFELMGKLWLRNEVRALESEVKAKPTVHFTPFLVIDAVALTDYATIVKALIKTKKFVVLIPSVVLTELDAMKKTSEDARNATRWLESEISTGSRFLRMQRSYETLAIPMLKAPRKFDREIFNFLQVAQFCNYMQASHADTWSGDKQQQPGVITLLTGARLSELKSDTFSYGGIMQAIAVQFESIRTFYAKYKNK